ncbi:MAG: hypothetical protein PHW92_01440 [Lutibacter sp.]|nr:hypothetical protein [Lutibacter sp.]
MKCHKFIIVAVFVGFFLSCEPPVVFSEPQPKGIDALTSISEHFQGIYWCDKDSVSLYVNKNLIYKSKMFDIALTQQEIDATKEVRFENGQLFFNGSKESFPAIEKNGIVFSTINLKDTIFSTQIPKHVLKYYKGHLILNNQISDNHWEVKIITLKPTGLITISKVDYPENLADIETITTVKIIDSSAREQILVSPTKTEFGQILDKNLIFTGTCQEFRPIIPLKNNAL